jgi:hypothetical protein
MSTGARRAPPRRRSRNVERKVSDTGGASFPSAPLPPHLTDLPDGASEVLQQAVALVEEQIAKDGAPRLIGYDPKQRAFVIAVDETLLRFQREGIAFVGLAKSPVKP